MLTESMARARYCCALSLASQTPRGLCLASECLAWRWQSGGTRQRIMAANSFATTEEGLTRPARASGWVFAPWDGSDHPAQWLEPESEHAARRRGYCGLAGRPEAP